MELNYNYVFLGCDVDYYKYAYYELNQYDISKFITKSRLESISLGRYFKLLRRIHFSSKINRFIDLPFKSIWNGYMLPELDFHDDKPICFIFQPGSIFSVHIAHNFIKYIRYKYPKCKCVLYYQDLIKIKRNISFAEYKKYMDMIISFDKNDSIKYGVCYYESPYSNINKLIEGVGEKSDIYFLGAAKNRLDKIYEAYDFFNSKGLSCKFIVVVKDKNKIKKHGDICFCDYIPYIENLKFVKACSYILEILQEGAVGSTFRALEAIAFNKKIITNNTYMQNSSYYDKDNVLIYENIRDLDMGFFDNKEATNYRNINKIKPYKLLEYIDRNLEDKSNLTT